MLWHLFPSLSPLIRRYLSMRITSSPTRNEREMRTHSSIHSNESKCYCWLAATRQRRRAAVFLTSFSASSLFPFFSSSRFIWHWCNFTLTTAIPGKWFSGAVFPLFPSHQNVIKHPGSVLWKPRTAQQVSNSSEMDAKRGYIYFFSLYVATYLWRCVQSVCKAAGMNWEKILARKVFEFESRKSVRPAAVPSFSSLLLLHKVCMMFAFGKNFRWSSSCLRCTSICVCVCVCMLSWRRLTCHMAAAAGNKKNQSSQIYYGRHRRRCCVSSANVSSSSSLSMSGTTDRHTFSLPGDKCVRCYNCLAATFPIFSLPFSLACFASLSLSPLTLQHIVPLFNQIRRGVKTSFLLLLLLLSPLLFIKWEWYTDGRERKRNKGISDRRSRHVKSEKIGFRTVCVWVCVG